jgi:hypothetical protein
MESRINIQLSYSGKNIKKNLFSKPHPNTEAKRTPSDENKQPEKLLLPKKNLSSYIYYRKIPKLDDKKLPSTNIKQKKIYIDSLTEVRLPLDFIDLSYDDHKKKG